MSPFLSSLFRFFKKPAVLGWLVFFLLFSVVAMLTYQRFLLYDAARTRELNNAVINAREKLKTALNSGLSATKTLSFIIERYYSVHDFDSVARTLLESNKFIDALELVEGGTITHVYPLEGNESAIGYNILEDSSVNREAFRTIRENQMFFAGPIRLKQGYDAIVGRLPIYRNGSYWGFSAVLIRLSTLIAAAELDSSASRDYIFQLSKKDPNTGIEQFFLPHAKSFDKKHSASVNVTEGDWRIYARFVDTETITSQLSFAIIGFLFAVSGGLFAWYGARQPIRLKEQVQEKTRQLSESESTLRGAFEYTAIGMALVSPRGNWLKVNDALCNMLGYSEEEMLTMSFRDITHPDDMESSIRFLEEAKKSGMDFYRAEKRYLTRHGAILWVNLNVSAVKDAKGQLQYFVAQTEDITEKKKVTALLEVRENQLRLFIDRSPASLAMFDKDMRYLVTSRRWLSDYDLEGKQVIGKKHYELFPNLPERWKEIHRRCMEGAVEKSDDDFYVDEDGKLSWLKWEIHPWRHYNGEIGGIIMFTEVITRLKEAELKFRNLVEQSLVGVCIVQDGKYAYVNPRFAEIHGYTPEEMTDSISADSVIGEDYREMVKHKLEPLLKEGIGYVHFEAKGKRKNGELIYVEAYGAGTTFNGRPAMIGTLLEITERKKAQEKLKESEEKFRNLVEKSLAGVYILQNGKVKYINPAHERMMGYSLQELQEIPDIEKLVHEEDIAVFRDHHAEGSAARKYNQPAIIRAMKKDGSMVYLEVTTSSIIYEGRPALIGTMLNITDRVQEEIRISRAVNEAQERERMEIGMELHDNVKQILAASLINIDHLATVIPEHKNAMDTIQNLKNYTKEAIDELRRLSHQLAPSINKNDSFSEQINKLVVTMNADNKLKVNIDVDEGPQPLRAEIRTAFYRILQEQVNNIMKYAQARSVYITIKPDKKNVLLSIRDNGIGLDINTKKDGIGLENIRRRAFALGGKAKFISSPGQGCEVQVQVPLV